MDLSDREHYLYRAFDERSRLLYVGRSCDVDGRFGGHRASSAWWPLMVHRTVDGPMSFMEVKDAERAAIDSESPLYNADAPGRGVVNGSHRAVLHAACKIAERDGWRFNDAWDIATATANHMVRRLPVGDPYTIDMQWSATAGRDAFMEDQIAYTFYGYRELVESGWKPECSPEARHQILPDHWNSITMGHLPPWRMV